MSDEPKNDPLTGHWADQINDPFFAKIMMDCWAIYSKKGRDYTQGKWDTDRLANFHKAADDAGTTVAQAWSVLFSKHLHAVQRYVKEGRVESEPIYQRVYDVINYMILLLLIIEEKDGTPNPLGETKESASPLGGAWVPNPPMTRL